MNTININRKPIKSSEIESYKDFKSLKNNYSKIPTKGPTHTIIIKFGIYGASVCIISALAWFLLSEKSEKSAIVFPQQEKLTFVNPPITNSNIPYKSIVYYNTADTIIEFAKSSIVEIKKNSLVDSLGKPVNGPIEIRYRQFMNPAEIFLSGIPMVYDSGGVKSTFESAGMIELGAFFQNKPVFIHPDKPIQVSFKSMKSERDYNLYYLDTLKQQWVFKGKNNVEIIKKSKIADSDFTMNNTNEISDSLNIIRNIISNLTGQKPVIPIQANAKKWHFTLDILPSEFPELSVYGKTVFEINEQYKPLNPKHPAIVWDDIHVEKAQKPMSLFVTFKKDTMKCKYLVQPVFSGKDYVQELKKYERNYTAYQSELTKRKIEEAIIIQKSITQDSLNRIQALLAPTEQIIKRGFQIQNFGIWNCDRPFTNGDTHISNPQYFVNDTFQRRTVYLADMSRNILLTFYDGNDLYFDRKSKTMIWMVTNKNQIAVVNTKAFEEILTNPRKKDIHLTAIKTPITCSADF
jgi:hypothetical protein